MRVLYVNAMNYGANAGVDAIAHGLDHRLTQAGIEMRVLTEDFREPEWLERQSAAVDAGVEAGVDGIVVYVLDDHNPAEAVGRATAAGIPVFTLERPRFAVEGCVVYPNFNHGVYMMEYLATILEPGARVGVLGGPDVVDDIELLLGIRHGIEASGLHLVNDPEDPRYKNISDVAEGGYEKTMNLLADFDDLAGVVPYNDETMHGTLRALRETGRLGTVKTVSRNGTPKAVEAILAGEHHGTWDLDCPGIGATVGDLVVRHLVDGEALDGYCAASPIGRMISPENAGAWIPWPERIPYEALREGL
ncbi:MAG: substrate-binding domain-containing protein [Acidimicrobiales bacterium]